MKEEKLDGFQLQHKNPENNRRIVTENGEKIYWLNLSNRFSSGMYISSPESFIAVLTLRTVTREKNVYAFILYFNV
jgi:hypothetical protein